MGRLRNRVLAVTVVSACGFSALTTGNMPDAGPCQAIGTTCSSDTLYTCTTLGIEPARETCNWGCMDGPPAHCGQATPSGALTPTDLENNPMIGSAISIGSGGSTTDINVDTGSIENKRGSGMGVMSGVEFTSRAGVGIFRFHDLTINGNIQFIGNNAVAFVVLGTLTVNAGLLNLQGDCSNNATDAGPGGFVGGLVGADAPGPMGGKGGLGGSNQCSGGAGGSYGTSGGAGGSSTAQANKPAAGAVVANAEITMLVGGGGGGGGGGSGSNRGSGGGGGGAIQIFAVGGILMNGSINASGCYGRRGSNTSCAGGGGAGGAILIEGKTLMFGSNAKLAVNGGGGGGAGNDGNSGAAGALALDRANGGASDGTANSGSGGSGGASAGLPGLTGVDAPNSPGGGGGGVGWMRFNTLAGSATVITGALCSPQFTDADSTVSQGKVHVE